MNLGSFKGVIRAIKELKRLAHDQEFCIMHFSTSVKLMSGHLNSIFAMIAQNLPLKIWPIEAYISRDE